MRITAGLYKGRSIKCPQRDVRPVMARMREAVFCILNSYFGSLQGLRFLDLFCGSASMSLEAASRGAGYIEAVEKDRRKKSIIEENLSIIQVPWDLHMLDVKVYLQKFQETMPFDVIYLDPPFAMKGKVNLLEEFPSSLLGEGGVLLMHLPKREEGHLPNALANGLGLLRMKHYGESALCIYSRG